MVSPGHYIVRIRAEGSHEVARSDPVRLWVRRSPIAFKASSLSPNVFNPRGDGESDHTTVGFDSNIRAEFEVVVRDATGNTVRDKRLGRLSAAPHTWNWHGRSDQGRVVDSGSYSIRVYATADERTDVTPEMDVMVGGGG